MSTNASSAGVNASNQPTNGSAALQNSGANQQSLNGADILNQSKDFQTMVSVLKDMGIEEFEPRVINQLLEFSYRYITNLLEDAKAFSNHAGKKNIDSEDIKMAIKSKVDYSFTTTPPRDVLFKNFDFPRIL
jgi:histone H3/H4